MNIVLDINDFDVDYVYFQESIKNTIILNSKFNRTLYSNSYFTLNIIFIKFNIKFDCKEKIYNKYKCYYNVSKNEYIIKKLIDIENSIMNKFNSNKKKSLKISQQLISGFVKLVNTSSDPSIFNKLDKYDSFDIILKISGIWETEFEFGLTYKFII